MKKAKLLVCIALAIFLIGLTFNVKAVTQSFEFTPYADKSTLNEGDEITIFLKLSSINMGDDGINTFGGKLVYDTNIFEEVKSNNFSSQNNWSIVYNDEQTDKKGTFMATIMTGTKEDQIIGTIKLKVKTNIKSTSTTIRFTEIASVGEETINLSDRIVNLNVIGTVPDDGAGGSGNDGSGNDGSGNGGSGIGGSGNGSSGIGGSGNGSSGIGGSGNGGSGIGGSGNGAIGGSNSANQGKLPQTGKESDILIMASSAILLVVIIFSFIKLKGMKDIK